MVLPRKPVNLLLILALVAAVSVVSVRAFETDPGVASLFSKMTNSAETEAWPDLVGMDKDEAKTTLERGFPHLQVFTVGQNRLVTMDYRRDRVRIFHDDQGVVVRVPRLG